MSSKASAIRGVFILVFLLATCAAHSQQPSSAPSNSQTEPDSSALPDSPGQTLQNQQNPTAADQENVVTAAKAYFASSGTKPPPCNTHSWLGHHPPPDELQGSAPPPPLPCVDNLNPYARFLDTTMPIPMTPAQKGYLAFRDVVDPFNLATIFLSSAVTIGFDAHSAYGPGFEGFAELSGVSLLQNATYEFFGTFVIPSIVHEDPHYHRLPNATFPRRLLHAISRTVIAQSDYGHRMPNYGTLISYPIASEISNLYVPGIESDGPSTVKRIFICYALDPVNQIVAEFLPDVAKHVNIHVIFVQQIINQIAVTSSSIP